MTKTEFMKLAESYIDSCVESSHACLNGNNSAQVDAENRVEIKLAELNNAVKKSSQNFVMGW